MSEALNSLVGVVVLIIVLAIIVVLVSKKTGTASLVSSFSHALDGLLSRSVGKT